jgi:hypothetical protein
MNDTPVTYCIVDKKKSIRQKLIGTIYGEAGWGRSMDCKISINEKWREKGLKKICLTYD